MEYNANYSSYPDHAPAGPAEEGGQASGSCRAGSPGGCGSAGSPTEPGRIGFSNVVIEPLFRDQVDFDTFPKSDFRVVKVLDCQAVKKSGKLLQFTLDDVSDTIFQIGRNSSWEAFAWISPGS